MTTDIVTFDADQIALIKSQIAPEATNDELALFLQVCKKTGLDPMSRQIYAIHRASNSKDSKGNWVTVKRMTIQTSIDGFRVIAERSGDYAGQTMPEWCGPDGKWTDIWLDTKPPVAARVGVWREGFKEPLVRSALWSEYAQTTKEGKPTGMWTKMPALMLAKCAEALALRAAFPADMSGLYTTDEMGQADGGSTPARTAKAPAVKKAAAPKEIEAPKDGVTEVTSGPATVAEAAKAQTEANKADAAKRGFAKPPQAGGGEPTPEPEPTDAQATETQMTALRDEVKQVTNGDIHKGLVEGWTQAGLPSIRDHAVMLSADQFEVAMRLALDATEKQAELKGGESTEEPLFDN